MTEALGRLIANVKKGGGVGRQVKPLLFSHYQHLEKRVTACQACQINTRIPVSSTMLSMQKRYKLSGFDINYLQEPSNYYFGHSVSASRHGVWTSGLQTAVNSGVFSQYYSQPSPQIILPICDTPALCYSTGGRMRSEAWSWQTKCRTPPSLALVSTPP